MKILLSLLIAFLFISCSTKNDRPEIKGYVYDFETKLPIQNVSISSEKGIETFTNKRGCFSLKKITKTKIFDFESGHDPKSFYFILSHLKFQSDTIIEETRGSFSNYKRYDSIFLKENYSE